MSQITDTQSYAKITRFQEVTITSKQNNLSLWVVEHINPEIRFEMEGEVVQANAPVLIKHAHTGKWLATDNVPYKTIFGGEFEVFTHSYQVQNKSQNLESERIGKSTGDTPMRSQKEQNTFVLISAASPNDDFDEVNSVSYDLRDPTIDKKSSQFSNF